MKYIIIGSGVAGISAIEAIRSQDMTGEVVMFGDDPHGYYSRPGLAYYLTGELHDKALFPRTTDDYRRMKFQYAREHVTRIDRSKHVVELGKKGVLEYDKLLIAVGAQAMSLETPGADLNGVLKLDHLEDARHILKFARRGKTAAPSRLHQCRIPRGQWLLRLGGIRALCQDHRHRRGRVDPAAPDRATEAGRTHGDSHRHSGKTIVDAG